MSQRVVRNWFVSILLLVSTLLLSPPICCDEENDHDGPALAGQIVDKKTGKPVTAFGIELFLRVGNSRESEHLFYREYRDDDGRFYIPLDQAGQYHFCVHSSRHEDIHGNEAPLIEGNETVNVRVELDSLRTVTGRVIDGETGEPVSGAIVSKYSIHIERIITGCSSYVVHAVTDSKGEYTLSGIDKDDEWDYDYPIVAVHPDYATNEVEDTHGSRIPDIVLRKMGHRISGLILDDAGNPCPGVVIEFYDSTSEGESGRSLQNYVISGDHGRYRTPLLKPGKTSLRAYAPNSRQTRHRPEIPFTTERKKVEIEGEDVVVDFGPMPHHATWRGRVIHESLLQSSSARIKLEPAEVKSEEPLEWVGSRGFSICDDDGSFSIAKIVPSRYRIMLTLLDYGYLDVDCGEIEIAAPGAFEKNIEIPERGLFDVPIRQGVGIPIITQGATERHDAEEGTRTFVFKVDPNGATVRGIHIEAPRDRKLVRRLADGEGNPVFTAPERWSFYQSFDGRVYHFLGDSSLPPGESEFSVTVPLVDGEVPLTSRVTFIFTEWDRLKKIVGITNRNAEGHDTHGPITR